MKTNEMARICWVLSITTLIGLAEDKVPPKTTPKIAAAAIPMGKKTDAKKTGDAPKLPVIGHLETRDRIITIQSGPAGLLYLVKTKDGKVLNRNLSEEQLKAQAPEIHELIKTSVAGVSNKDGSFLDARQ
ncbi:MAG TPA: hypothetical protein VEL06_09145 [Haliangiales bacterium]|nr:hypothetical protein [Haliangiales bacterium]